MKKFTLLLALAVLTLSTAFAQTIDRVEPLFWWAGMKNPELQLMVYGKDIASYRPSIADENVNKLVNIFDVLLAKVRLNEAVSNIKQSAYEHETIAKKLRDDAKDLEERIPSLLDGLMEEKGLTSNGRFFNPYSIS